MSSSIDLINPDYWLIFCEISRGQQWDSFGANNSREAARNPREVRRKGSAELGEGHSTFRLLRNQFPFSGKMSLVFYWPISFKSPTSFPGQPRHLWAKIGGWNSEQNNRCIKNTSVHNRMWLCWNQLLEDLCIFERADSQLGAWAFTENMRMPMRVRVHMHVCAHVCACTRARVCVSECWICASLWRTRKDGEGANLFLCRLTLSFQTHLFSKPPTISTVSPPRSPSPFSQNFPYPPTVPGILRICVGDDKPGDAKAA